MGKDIDSQALYKVNIDSTSINQIVESIVNLILGL